jgi:CHC2 zinc finger
MNQDISDLCQKARISDYLASKGVVLQRAGRRQKCCCPLHNERTPSFYITTLPDGTELFKCWGCDKGGNIITLVAAMEGISNGTVIKDLANKFKVKLGKFSLDEKVEPLNDEILNYFCQEDEMLLEMADWIVPFLSKNPSQDIINKVSRVYEKIDMCRDTGDYQGITTLIQDVLKITSDYAAVENTHAG